MCENVKMEAVIISCILTCAAFRPNVFCASTRPMHAWKSDARLDEPLDIYWFSSAVPVSWYNQ